MSDRREDTGKRDRIDEIAENYRRTDATVIGILNSGRWALRLMVVLVVLGCASSYYFYGQNKSRSRETRDLIAANSRAIVTGCDLLVDVAAQAGIAPSRKGESKASRINRVLTVTVIDEVLRTAPASVRERVTELYHRLLKAGPVIRLPDCATVGKQPAKESNP